MKIKPFIFWLGLCALFPLKGGAGGKCEGSFAEGKSAIDHRHRDKKPNSRRLALIPLEELEKLAPEEISRLELGEDVPEISLNILNFEQLSAITLEQINGLSLDRLNFLAHSGRLQFLSLPAQARAKQLIIEKETQAQNPLLAQNQTKDIEHQAPLPFEEDNLEENLHTLSEERLFALSSDQISGLSLDRLNFLAHSGRLQFLSLPSQKLVKQLIIERQEKQPAPLAS